MATLHNLTQGLAVVQQGLEKLDAGIRHELKACADLRKRANEAKEKTQQLQAMVEEAKLTLHNKQDENEDLAAILDCIQQQTVQASKRKKEKQDHVGQLTVQLASLVDAFEQDSDKFCAALSRQQMDQQQLSVEQEEQEAEAKVKALQQQLQIQRMQLSQHQALVKQLREQLVDSKISIQELKQQIAAESSVSHKLMLELEQAQHDGPTAQQLAKLKAELAEREEHQLNQRCCIAAQDVELDRASTEVRQRQQEVARKKADLAGLNRTIQALGLPPVLQLDMPTATPPAAAAPAVNQSPAALGALSGQYACATSRGPAFQQHSTQQTGWQRQQHGLTSKYAQQQQQPQHGWYNFHEAQKQQCARPAPHHQQQQVLQQHNCSLTMAPNSSHAAPATPAAPPQQQQQYIVEEPDDVPESCDPGNILSHSSAPGNALPAVQHAASMKGVAGMQLVLHHEDGGGGGKGTAGDRPMRGRVVVSETVVTTTTTGSGTAPAALQKQRMVVLEEKGSMPSSSGGRMVPASKRTVILEESEHRITPAGKNCCNPLPPPMHPILAGSRPHQQTAATANVSPDTYPDAYPDIYPDVYSDSPDQEMTDNKKHADPPAVPSGALVTGGMPNGISRPCVEPPAYIMQEPKRVGHHQQGPADWQQQQQQQYHCSYQPYPGPQPVVLPHQRSAAYPAAAPCSGGGQHSSTTTYTAHDPWQQQQRKAYAPASAPGHGSAAGEHGPPQGQQRYRTNMHGQPQAASPRRLQQQTTGWQQHIQQQPPYNGDGADAVCNQARQQRPQQQPLQDGAHPGAAALPVRSQQQPLQHAPHTRPGCPVGQHYSFSSPAQQPAAATHKNLPAPQYSQIGTSAPTNSEVLQSARGQGSRANSGRIQQQCQIPQRMQHSAHHFQKQWQQDPGAVSVPNRPFRKQPATSAYAGTGSNSMQALPGSRRQLAARVTDASNAVAGAPGIITGRVAKPTAGKGGKCKGHGNRGGKKTGVRAGRQQVSAVAQDNDDDEFGQANNW